MEPLNPLLVGRMTAQVQERPKTGHEKNIEGEARLLLERIGRYESVQRFISNYAKMTIKKACPPGEKMSGNDIRSP